MSGTVSPNLRTHFVGISVGGKERPAAQLLRAFLLAEVGDKQPPETEERINLYGDRRLPPSDLEKWLKEFSVGAGVLVAIIGPSYDKSAPCGYELAEIIRRIHAREPDSFAIALLEGTQLPRELEKAIEVVPSQIFDLPADCRSGAGFERLGLLAAQIVERLVRLQISWRHPRQTDPRDWPYVVERHLNDKCQLYSLPQPSDPELLAREGLHGAALFAGHLEQARKAAALFKGFQAVFAGCPTSAQRGAFTDDEYQTAFRECQEVAVSQVLSHLLTLKDRSVPEFDDFDRICVAVVRLKAYALYHWKSATLLRPFADLVLPDGPPAGYDGKRFNELAHYVRASSEKLKQLFFSEPLPDDAVVCRTTAELTRLRSTHDKRFDRNWRGANP